MLIMLKCVVFFLIFTVSFAQHRKISVFINPGCSSGCRDDKNVLVHITADGLNDTLHHVWDFTHKPAVLLGLTPLNTTLSINWTEFQNGIAGSVKFSKDPLSVFSFVVDQLIEFNDKNNSAAYDPMKYNVSDTKVYKIQDFDWKFDRNKLKNTTELCSVVMEGKQHHGHPKTKGLVTLTLSAFGNVEHSTIKPHLLHTVNASQVDIVLEDLTTTDAFKSRFALGLSIASTDSFDSTATLIDRKSLDDEHSPGVFDIGEVKTKSGYLMWRTVAYTTRDRMPTSSTSVKPGLYLSPSNSSFNNTIISSLFGNKMDKMLVRNSVFSFGQAGVEDLYTNSRYLSWTFLSGVGVPVDDSYSLLIQLITIFGIGLPVLIVLLGLTCIVMKRLSRQSHDIVFAEH